MQMVPNYQSFGLNVFTSDQKFVQFLNTAILEASKGGDFYQMTRKNREIKLENVVSQQFYKLKKVNPMIKVFIHENVWSKF